MCYTCELTVNGVNYGVKALSPYKYKIPIDKLKQKDNVIELRVTNTMANATFTRKYLTLGIYQVFLLTIICKRNSIKIRLKADSTDRLR